MTTTLNLPTPSVNDEFTKGRNRYLVVAVIGSTVKLKGMYGAEFNEPIQKLIDSGYSLKSA